MDNLDEADKQSLALVRATGKGLQFHLGKCSGNDEEFLAYTDFFGLGLKTNLKTGKQNIMLKTALARVNGDTEKLEKDMAILLESFVRNKMRPVKSKMAAEAKSAAVNTPPINSPMMPQGQNNYLGQNIHAAVFSTRQQHQTFNHYFNAATCTAKPAGPTEADLAELYRLYCVFDGTAHTPGAFTLSRLSLTFPYETALIRMKHPAESFLPGQLNPLGHMGQINSILAFPGAPLIIPATWTATLVAWRQWFIRFLTYSVGFPLTEEHERRLQHFCEVMLWNAPASDRAMELLGIRNI